MLDALGDDERWAAFKASLNQHTLLVLVVCQVCMSPLQKGQEPLLDFAETGELAIIPEN
jgi:hypothetical protein